MPRQPEAVATHSQNVLPLYRYLPFKIGEISNKLTRGASRVYFKHFGIGGLEWRIVAMLAIDPNIAASRIVEQVGLNKGAVSRVLGRLQQRGFVVVTALPGQRRRRSIALTEKGKVLHDQVLKVALERECRLIALLTPHELDILLDLLDRLAAQLPAGSAYDPGKAS